MKITVTTTLLWVTVGVLMVFWWHLPTVASHPLHALFTEEISTRENSVDEDNFLYGIRPHPQFAAITDFGGRRRRRAIKPAAEDRKQPVAAASGNHAGRDLTASATGYGSGAYGPTGYTNYGARTGGYGAFSWYTDHPVGGGYGGYHG